MVSADGFSFMVPKAAKNAEAAKVLTQFLASTDNQALMTATFPARESSAKDSRFSDPLLQPFLEQQSDHAFPAPAYVGWDQFISTVQSALQSVALGDRTAADANQDILQQAGLVLKTK
jgi:multiple sugar transport system substrate-binding protein